MRRVGGAGEGASELARDHRAPHRLRGDPRQGPARRAAHPAVAAGDGDLRRHHLRDLPLRPRPHPALRAASRLRRALGDAAVLPPCSASTACRRRAPRRAASTRSGWRRSTAASSSPPRRRALVGLTCSPWSWSRSRSSPSSSSTRSRPLGPLLSVLLLADLGLAATGTLISSMAVNSGPRPARAAGPAAPGRCR